MLADQGAKSCIELYASLRIPRVNAGRIFCLTESSYINIYVGELSYLNRFRNWIRIMAGALSIMHLCICRIYQVCLPAVIYVTRLRICNKLVRMWPLIFSVVCNSISCVGSTWTISSNQVWLTFQKVEEQINQKTLKTRRSHIIPTIHKSSFRSLRFD